MTSDGQGDHKGTAKAMECNRSNPCRHKIQGWTPDFIPEVLDRDVAHENIPVSDIVRESIRDWLTEAGYQVATAETGEEALEITEALVRSGAVDIIVIDSVAALVPKAEIEGDMGDSHIGLQARLMSQALRKLTAAIGRSGTAVVFINQLREKVGMTGCVYLIGCRAVGKSSIGVKLARKLGYEFLDTDTLVTEKLGCSVAESVRREGWEKFRALEKEVLLQEIHHRVKNNLQVISSLLNLQARYIKEDTYADMFRDSQNRIMSMALVHEELYQSKDLARIDLNDYIRNLTNALFRSYGADTGSVALKIDVADVVFGVDTAIPCGLIINELVSNSLKYAFPGGKEGEITIALRPTDGDEIDLTVSDNGVSIPDDLDLTNTGTLGIKLVHILTDQIRGRLEVDRSEGTTFRIRFKRIQYKERV